MNSYVLRAEFFNINSKRDEVNVRIIRRENLGE